MPNIPQIIYKDEAIIIIDKPQGMPSVSLKEGEDGTLAAWLVKNVPGQEKIVSGLEAGLIHRLDNGTSGVIVAARDLSSYTNLRLQFDRGLVKKEYTALVVGCAPDKGVITAPIAHHPRKKKKMLVCASDTLAKKWKARLAQTEFETKRRHRITSHGSKADYTLISVTIYSGVRHQIRSHLAAIGFPIAGDGLYQNPKSRARDILDIGSGEKCSFLGAGQKVPDARRPTNEARGVLGMYVEGLVRRVTQQMALFHQPHTGRYFLHASKITFTHPVTGDKVEFRSPLPGCLSDVLSSLELVS